MRGGPIWIIRSRWWFPDDTFLIFLGIPPVYAVPNEINNILATSVSGSMTHWFKRTLDYKMGFMIIVGGVLGTVLGIAAFKFLRNGKLSLIISLFICIY